MYLLLLHKLKIMMKKILTAIACISFFTANATIHEVHVQNYQFTPDNFNAVVGDTVQWIWDNGSHTTTSTSVPTGAAPWNSPINGSNTLYTYVITVEGTYDYWCIPHAPDMAGHFTVTAALPVVLTNFKVSSNAEHKALISWATATEQNTDYFSVKKSVDGNQFTQITKVNAAGNSTTLQQYSYTDVNVGSENKFLYYMIETVDKDGKKQLSDIQMFRNSLAVSKLIAKLSPNPISNPGHLMLQFNADKEGTMLAKLFDANGKFVKQSEFSAVVGLNNGHFHLGSLTAGVYTIVFTLKNIKEVQTILVQ